MNCESCELPKYSLTTAPTGFALIEIVRHQRVDFLRHAHALLDGARHAHETDAVLHLHQLADRAHAAVAEVVDVVDRAAPFLSSIRCLTVCEDVFARERGLVQTRLLLLRQVLVELVVQLQATDRRQVVALGVEEQVVEQRLRRLERRADRPGAGAGRSP